MTHWIKPNSVGMILLLYVFCFEGLCGEPTHPLASPIITEEPISSLTITTFGLPTVFEIIAGDSKTLERNIHWANLFLVVVLGWCGAMGIGRLAIDGGADPATASLLPVRKHPAVLLLGYVAAVPILASFGLFMDARQGIRALGSPTGPTMYPLLVLTLLAGGIPIVTLLLASRRVLDRIRAKPRFSVKPIVFAGQDMNEIAGHDITK